MLHEAGYVNWINQSGYEIVSAEGSSELICEVSPIERSQKNVLTDGPALHRELAALEPSTDAVLKFAAQYGLLEGRAPGSGYSKEQRHVKRKADELQLWYREIAAMKEAVNFYDLAYGEYAQVSPKALSKRFQHLGSGTTTEGLEQLSKQVEKRDSMWLRERWKGADGWRNLEPIVAGMSEQENFIGAARAALVKLVNRGLRNRVGPELIYDYGKGGSLVSTPLTMVTTGGLIGALWLQLAKAIDERKFFRQCLVCEAWFEGRAGVGNRKGRDYCSDACRQKAYRGRRRETKTA